MKQQIGTLCVLAQLLSGAAAAQTPSLACSVGRSRHLYASAVILDISKPDQKTIVGNAFAIHAIPLGPCLIENEKCRADGKAAWKVLYATAAHVISDTCKLVAAGKSIALFAPERPRLAQGYLLKIDVEWCTNKLESFNYFNAAYKGSITADRDAGTELINSNDRRKTGDQFFFAQDILVDEQDYVTPYLIAPLPSSAQEDDLRLRVEGFTPAGLNEKKGLLGLIWSGDDSSTTTLRAILTTYILRGVVTLPGTSGSPVLQVISQGEGRPRRYRAVGIVTDFTPFDCSVAAAGEPVANAEDKEATDSATAGAQVANDNSDQIPDETTANQRQIDDLRACMNNTSLKASNKDKTEFIPIMRFPSDLLAFFERSLSQSGVRSSREITPSVSSWSTSPGMMRPLRRLMEHANGLHPGQERKQILEAINEIMEELPPYEATFALTRLAASSSVLPGLLDEPGCSRVEPSFESPVKVR